MHSFMRHFAITPASTRAWASTRPQGPVRQVATLLLLLLTLTATIGAAFVATLIAAPLLLLIAAGEAVQYARWHAPRSGPSAR
jgi:hypothetical protein